MSGFPVRWLVAALSAAPAALAAGCGLQVAGHLAPDPGPAGSDGGQGLLDDAGPPGLARDGGLASGDATSTTGTPVDGSAGADSPPSCFPAPRACSTSSDCSNGRRCCFATGTNGALTTSCQDECDDGRVEACATTPDCQSGSCAPRACSCGDVVLACAPIPGACL